jgi:hypothetical protein
MNHKNTLLVASKNFPSWAVGWWQDRDDDVAVRFHFSLNKESATLTVRAFNSHDGEEMIVKNLLLRDKWLSFTTMGQSTKFQAVHRWRFRRDKKAVHELTLSEIWQKVEDERFDGLLIKRKKGKAPWPASHDLGCQESTQNRDQKRHHLGVGL